jgi:hypothetical protein
VSPGRKLVRPGDEFELVWLALDAAGCGVAIRPGFDVQSEDPLVAKAIEVAPSGRVAIASGAPEGTATVSVVVGGRAAPVVIEITTPERYVALLAERGLDPLGDGEAAVLVLPSAVGGQAAAVDDGARDRRMSFIAVVVGAAAALALAALVLLRRNKGKRDDAEPQSVPGAAPLVALYDRPAADDPMRCPQCREVYAASSAFCPVDGAPLVPAPRARVSSPRLPPASVAPTDAAVAKVCPTCGGRYDEASAFCGKDGTQLVAVN